MDPSISCIRLKYVTDILISSKFYLNFSFSSMPVSPAKKAAKSPAQKAVMPKVTKNPAVEKTPAKKVAKSKALASK